MKVGTSRKVISVTRTASFDLKGASRTVKLALSSAGSAALKRNGKLAVKVVVDPKTGANVTKAATLRR